MRIIVFFISLLSCSATHLAFSQSECPNGADISTNEKCVDLGGNFGESITIDGVVYNWNIGANTYLRLGAKANSCNNIDPFTGTITLEDGTECEYQAGVLPVELITFDAAVDGPVIRIRWETASEINNLGFILESSVDAVKWNEVAFIQGKLNSETLSKYTYTDTNPIRNLAYYRLSQIDMDGGSRIYPILYVNRKKGSIQLFPNPVNSTIFSSSMITSYSVYDATGALVMKNENYNEKYIPFALLSNGVYFITGYSETGPFSQQILKH